MDTAFQIGPWLVSPRLNRIARNGKTIHLEPKIMSVLVCLAEHKSEVVSKEQLFAAIWPETFVTDDVLKRSISELRKALEDDPKEPRFVETIPKGGYRLLIPASPVIPKADLGRLNFGATFRRAAFLGGVVTLLFGTLAVWFRSPTPPPKALGYTQLTTDGLEKTPPLLTDGSRIYFAVATATGRYIGQVSTSGGQTVPVPTPFRVVRATDVSPSGSELLVGNFFGGQKEVPVFVLPLPGGSPGRLGSLLSKGDIAWSPDGKQIAYMKGADLWLAKSDGTEPRKVAALPGVPFDRELHWSPNGKVLRFWLADGKRVALWEISANGAHLHQLLEHWDREVLLCCGNWTADGRYFIFQSCPADAGPVRIWAIREGRGLLQRTSSQPMLLAETPLNVYGTVPSRDGKKLFVNSYTDRMELVRYSATSGKFVPYLAGIAGLGASFSRDGQWVTYMSWPDGLLWRSKLDGSQRLKLSSFGADGASWSPDGKQIAFAGDFEDAQHIYVISAEGGNAQQLTTGDHEEAWPDWSPDGNFLLFGSAGHEPETAIQIFDLRTQQVSTVPGSEGLIYGRWSPDGRYIAASGANVTSVDQPQIGEKKLSVFDSRTQKWVELAKGQLTWPTWPTWSRDGRYIYVRETIEGEAYLVRVRISDHTLETITSLNDLKQRQSRFQGTWIGLGPDGSLLALRDLSSSEIFSLDLQLP
jgi:Tol biopolymer transport system component/DNA-binding winged helix-turn-helix (wHTH) protein